MEIALPESLYEPGNMEDLFPNFTYDYDDDYLSEFTKQEASLNQELFNHSLYALDSFSYEPNLEATKSPLSHDSAVEMRPRKRLRTNNPSSPSPSSSSSSSAFPNIISFGNPNLPPCDPYESVDHKNVILPLTSLGTSERGTKRARSRTPNYAQVHLIAERNRRERLNQLIISLSSIIPGLKKMDKATILEDAIKYMKRLQERVNELEQVTEKKVIESVVLVAKSSEESTGKEECHLPEIEARVLDKDVLIRVHCKKEKGVLRKVMSKVEELHLNVINSNALPFGNSSLHITIIAQLLFLIIYKDTYALQMDAEFCMTTKDLAQDLRKACL
ncbi:Myc-type, basic helix-loop-helix (bHLH) domain [Dillenia turbinata]|uniref:Myc-type, basic helix-loop-helix (BHLH) domain n=1 Tax=Dillenia turbinata TaxID=194707 RepID=A0AAN8Z5F2_9MAGN